LNPFFGTFLSETPLLFPQEDEVWLPLGEEPSFASFIREEILFKNINKIKMYLKMLTPD
jgi:hypothetical protein